MLKINNIISLLPLVAVAACTDLTFYGETGSQPDAATWEKEMTVSLKTKQYTENTVELTLTNEYGITSAELDLVLRSNQPAGQRLSVDLTVDGSLLRGYEAEAGLGVGTMKILPSAYYRFTDGTYISLPKGSRESSPYGLEVYARNSVGQSLAPGRYLLPIVASTSAELSENTVFVDVTVPEPYEDPDGVKLYSGKDMFTVCYLNTSMFDPRLANDMVLMTYYGDENSPRIGFGNIVNLRTASVGYDETTGKVSVTPSSDLRYVLEHYAERVAPVQESGRKVCICIEGGGKGIGFCNFNDDQIADFVASVKSLVDTYRLDGVNLWDRNAGYGQDGLPPMNTTSYPVLIKKLREALGSQKFLTIVDYQEPTAYFDDTEKTGGIAVGEFIDYAWHGYNDASEPLQVIDPWSEADYLSTKYTGTKIAGLDHINYGCIHWSPRVDGYGFSDSAKPWVEDNKPYAIFVFYDIQSNLQSGGSDNAYQYPGKLISSAFNRNYDQDLGRLKNTEHTGQTSLQYGKWLKDW